jgi:hypothetical protein
MAALPRVHNLPVTQEDAKSMSRNRFLALILALAAIALGGCSASTISETPTPAATATATPTPIPAPTPTPIVDLSGNWTGQYSGPFNGTFVLQLNESGSALHGVIELSSPRETLQISGTVTGSSISFGAVGVVTYTGTVSLSGASNLSMSGSYTDIANGHTGSWSATGVPGGAG